MDSPQSTKDYEILGYKVKLCTSENQSVIAPDQIVDHVQKRVMALLTKMPHLDRGEAALLLALSLVQEKFELQAEFRENVNHFHKFAKDTLRCIEDISPGIN